MKNRKNIFFAFKLILGFRLQAWYGLLLIYYFSGAEIPNFKIAYWIGGQKRLVPPLVPYVYFRNFHTT